MSPSLFSAAVTPRGFLCAIASVIGAACIAFGLVVALPMASAPASGSALFAKPDFDFVFESLSSTPPVKEARPGVTPVDFNLAFASVALRDNTPGNREKLRNAGWQRVLRRS